MVFVFSKSSVLSKLPGMFKLLMLRRCMVVAQLDQTAGCAVRSLGKLSLAAFKSKASSSVLWFLLCATAAEPAPMPQSHDIAKKSLCELLSVMHPYSHIAAQHQDTAAKQQK